MRIAAVAIGSGAHRSKRSSGITWGTGLAREAVGSRGRGARTRCAAHLSLRENVGQRRMLHRWPQDRSDVEGGQPTGAEERDLRRARKRQLHVHCAAACQRQLRSIVRFEALSTVNHYHPREVGMRAQYTLGQRTECPRRGEHEL